MFVPDSRHPVRAAVRVAAVLVLIALCLWGARVVWLDGLRYGLRPEGFPGDFTAAVGQQQQFGGIFYGPLFVIESWLNSRWPEVFSIRNYGMANVPLVAIAFLACLRAGRLRGFAALLTLALWLDFSRLAIAIGTAANPEVVELTLLSFAWLAASRGATAREGMAIAFAGLMKFVPYVFFAQVLIGRKRRGVLAALMVAIPVVVVVGVGEHLGVVGTISATFLPFGGTGVGLTLPLYDLEYKNLSSVIGRLLVSTHAVDESTLIGSVALTSAVQGAGVVIALALTAGACWAAYGAMRSPMPRDTVVALVYTLFFALLPVWTLRAHQQTFVLLLPVWTAVVAVLAADPRPMHRWLFATCFASCYALIGFPAFAAAVDRVLHGSLQTAWAGVEPMVIDVALVIVATLYSLGRSGGAGMLLGPPPAPTRPTQRCTTVGRSSSQLTARSSLARHQILPE